MTITQSTVALLRNVWLVLVLGSQAVRGAGSFYQNLIVNGDASSGNQNSWTQEYGDSCRITSECSSQSMFSGPSNANLFDVKSCRISQMIDVRFASKFIKTGRAHMFVSAFLGADGDDYSNVQVWEYDATNANVNTITSPNVQNTCTSYSANVLLRPTTVQVKFAYTAQQGGLGLTCDAWGTSFQLWLTKETWTQSATITPPPTPTPTSHWTSTTSLSGQSSTQAHTYSVRSASSTTTFSSSTAVSLSTSATHSRPSNTLSASPSSTASPSTTASPTRSHSRGSTSNTPSPSATSTLTARLSESPTLSDSSSPSTTSSPTWSSSPADTNESTISNSQSITAQRSGSMNTASMTGSCGLAPIVTFLTAESANGAFGGTCDLMATKNWTREIPMCVVGGSQVEVFPSLLQFSRSAPPFPYLLQLPLAPQRQWRYNCPTSRVPPPRGGIPSCFLSERGDVVLLTFLMTSSMASAVLECGVETSSVSWTVTWVTPMSTPVEVVATIAAGGALLSGGGSAAVAMALVSLMSCSGKAPALASLGYVVSVFFDLKFSGMAVGNIGLIVGHSLLHFLCVFVWKFIRHSPSLAIASSDLRFPALSLLVAAWLLPGSVYAAVAAIASNDDAAIGAVVLGLVSVAIGISQFLLHHKVLPHAEYVPHKRRLLPTGTRFPVLWRLIPESQWSPPSVVRRYHPLMTSRCRTHSWTAVLDTMLTCLLSVVAALGVGGDVSSCRVALIVVALLLFVYGVALAVLRAHRFPMDRFVFPFIQWGYGVLCVLKLVNVSEGTGEAVQLAVSVLQMWQVGWSFWVFFVERSLAAAEAAGSSENGNITDIDERDNDEELTQHQADGPHLSHVWLDTTAHEITILNAGDETLALPQPVDEDDVADESKFWDVEGFAVFNERDSDDSFLIQPLLPMVAR